MDGILEKGTEPAGLSERPQEAGGDKSVGGPPARRFSAKRKLRAVSRLLRGEPLELLARELNITAARLSEWRDRALLAAEAALKEHERDNRDDEIARLKGKVGEMTMQTELLREKIARLEAGAPLARRRSRP
jgi:transposase-like protein